MCVAGNQGDAPWAASSSLFSLMQEAGPLAAKPAGPPPAAADRVRHACVTLNLAW